MIPETDLIELRRRIKKYYKMVERKDYKYIAEASAAYQSMKDLYLLPIAKPEVIILKGRH